MATDEELIDLLRNQLRFIFTIGGLQIEYYDSFKWGFKCGECRYDAGAAAELRLNADIVLGWIKDEVIARFEADVRLKRKNVAVAFEWLYGIQSGITETMRRVAHA